MINAILNGILLGLVLSIMIGPVFFLLLNTSIKKGFKPAVYLALGVALSDVMFITICFFGNSLLGSLNAHSTQIGWLGGGLLIIFGLVALFKKVSLSEKELKLPDDSKTLLIDTGKGFMMNTLNPFVLVFWLGVITAVNAGQFGGKAYTLFFFIAVIITVFSVDLLKSFLASRLKRLLTQNVLVWMNRISGTALILYGIKLIYDIN